MIFILFFLVILANGEKLDLCAATGVGIPLYPNLGYATCTNSSYIDANIPLGEPQAVPAALTPPLNSSIWPLPTKVSDFSFSFSGWLRNQQLNLLPRVIMGIRTNGPTYSFRLNVGGGEVRSQWNGFFDVYLEVPTEEIDTLQWTYYAYAVYPDTPTSFNAYLWVATEEFLGNPPVFGGTHGAASTTFIWPPGSYFGVGGADNFNSHAEVEIGQLSFFNYSLTNEQVNEEFALGFRWNNTCENVQLILNYTSQAVDLASRLRCVNSYRPGRAVDIRIKVHPSLGTVNGSYIYQPFSNFTGGQDTFIYEPVYGGGVGVVTLSQAPTRSPTIAPQSTNTTSEGLSQRELGVVIGATGSTVVILVFVGLILFI